MTHQLLLFMILLYFLSNSILEVAILYSFSSIEQKYPENLRAVFDPIIDAFENDALLGNRLLEQLPPEQFFIYYFYVRDRERLKNLQSTTSEETPLNTQNQDPSQSLKKRCCIIS